MSSKDILIFSAINELEKAQDIITDLLEKDLIKSGTIFPEVQLLYKWEGKINMDDEIKILLKTTSDKIPAIEDYIMQNHPYTYPEIVTIPVEFGSDKFRNFLKSRQS